MFHPNNKMNYLMFISIHLFILLISTYAQNEPIVATPFGQIQGSLMTTNQGKTIYAFRGIPYAHAPIGELRFKAPIPMKHYNGTFDARNEGPACYQDNANIELSEDCLRLNVYTRNIPKTHWGKKKPVIVSVHPGGFYALSGQSLFFGPQYFLDQKIVLVTINYRLGSLGFISTGDEEAPGNNGLKDQIAALKWIKRNIAAFGGDPDNVTFLGYSAGSVSAILHLISPMAKGLFHKIIAMSGAVAGNWEPISHQRHLADKQAVLVGCPTNSTADMMACLRTLPASQIANTFNDFFEINSDPILVWSPVIELDFGQERYLTDDPAKLLRFGDFSDIPAIIGVTEFEFAAQGYAAVLDNRTRNEMNENWETLAPIVFLYERNTSRSRNISEALKDYYLNSQDIQINNESLTAMANLYADAVIGFSVHRSANLLARSNKKHLYYYRFSYKGRYSFFYLPGGNSSENIPLGAVHHDDLMYLFYISALFPRFSLTDPEYNMVVKMTKMWADFAKCGNPTPEKSTILNNLTWPSYREDKAYVDIGNELQIKNCLYCDRYNVWDELFPVYAPQNFINRQKARLNDAINRFRIWYGHFHRKTDS